MRNLAGIGTAAALTIATPVVMQAQVDRLAESAQGVYSNVMARGSPTVFQYVSDWKIDAKYLPFQGKNTVVKGFFAFELDGLPHLVMRVSNGSETFDVIDEAQTPDRNINHTQISIDSKIDDAIFEANGIRTKAYHYSPGMEILYHAAVSLAYERIPKQKNLNKKQ